MNTRQALAHFSGIGPKTAAKLRKIGCNDWLTLRQSPGGFVVNDDLRAEIDACETALQNRDLVFLSHRLEAADHWRLLVDFREDLAFFDIETTGTGTDDQITTICVYFHDRLYTFVEGFNLAEFVDLLAEKPLLVSFNGNSFDVPKVEEGFHIPSIDCGHVDLRWVCYHENLRGGLKEIEKHLAIERTEELVGVDGAEAVILWEHWQRTGNQEALEKLCRYCGADVLGLDLLVERILRACDPDYISMPARDLWRHLDGQVLPETPPNSINFADVTAFTFYGRRPTTRQFRFFENKYRYSYRRVACSFVSFNHENKAGLFENRGGSV